MWKLSHGMCWLECDYCKALFAGFFYVVCPDCRVELKRRENGDELSDAEFAMVVEEGKHERERVA